MTNDDQIADLQMRLTYQEDDIKALNTVVRHQQEQLDALHRDIERLRELLATMAHAGNDAAADERPPHY